MQWSYPVADGASGLHAGCLHVGETSVSSESGVGTHSSFDEHVVAKNLVFIMLGHLSALQEVIECTFFNLSDHRQRQCT